MTGRFGLFIKDIRRRMVKKGSKAVKLYIKEAVAKGHSLDTIKKKFISSGYTEQLINPYLRPFKFQQRKDNFIGAVPLVFLFLFVSLLFFSFDSGITAFVVSEQSNEYNDTLSLAFVGNATFKWTPQHVGVLTSIALDGHVGLDQGYSRVYVLLNDTPHLILDSFFLSNESTEVISEVIDNSSSIKISLAYQDGTVFDSDNDGVTTEDDAVDFTLANTQFDWGVDESLLCSRYTIQGDTDGDACFGNSDCCLFLGLENNGDNWNDPLYLTVSNYGSGKERTVNAQIVYYNVSLDIENPYSDIISSGFVSLSALFSDNVITFAKECGDNCLISSEQIEYTFIVELENAILNIEKIHYSVVSEEKLVPIEDILVIVENKDGISVAQHEFISRGDSKFDLEITKEIQGGKGEYGTLADEKSVVIRELSSLPSNISIALDVINDTQIKTEVFAVDTPLSFTNATITLDKQSEVDHILRCPDFDIDTFSCSSWNEINIPFVDNGDTITFTVDSFSGFGGGFEGSGGGDDYGISISSCGTVSVSSILTTDVTSTGTCFTIDTDDVILDCDGYTISYGSDGTNGKYGITSSTQNNITMKDCIIKDINGSSSQGYGIRFSSVTNGTIFNNTISTNGTQAYGISLSSSSFNNITSNNVSTDGPGNQNFGLSFSISSYNNLISNTISTNGTDSNYGIRFSSSSSNNNIISNTISANGSASSNIGLSLESSNNTITNNTISTYGSSSNWGIYIISSYNTLTNNTIFTDGASGSNNGIYLQSSSSNNSIISNSINTLGTNSHAFVFDVSGSNYPENNSLTNNTLGAVGGEDLNFKDAGINGTRLIDQSIRDYSFAGAGGLVTFEDTNEGIIKFLEPISGSGTNLSGDIIISNNSIFVNSSSNSGLNKSANITLENLGFSLPIIQVDLEDDGSFVTCDADTDPSCVNLSFSGSTFVFNVSHFTSYQSAETDILPPTYNQNSTNGTNNTKISETVWFAVNWTDDTELSVITLSINNGSWYNVSSINVSGNTSYLFNTTYTIDIGRANVFTWKFYANDSSGNVNVTLNATFTIANTLPTHGTPILNSTLGNNLTSENLTVYFQNVVDADGDFVQNITDWRLYNGTDFESIAVLNMPFETNTSSTTTGAIRDYSTYKNNGTLGGGTASNVPTWNNSGQNGGRATTEGDHSSHSE